MTNYEQRLEAALKKQADIKDEIDFLRLQIKQEKKQEKWASRSPVISQIKAKFPDLRVDNGAGLTYLTMNFSVLDQSELPQGWTLFDANPQDKQNLGSPIVERYKYPDVPAMLYITRQVR